MVTIKCVPKFKKTDSYLERLKEVFKSGLLDKYGKMGVDALRDATPKDTGLTSESWVYDIARVNHTITITWRNTNLNNGVPVAVLIQYGHATRNGGFVKGIDYVNPAMAPIFQQIAEEAWKEVKK